ncbi:MAG: histidine kinase [bacterium]|nr:histidine kinase [bacterium]
MVLLKEEELRRLIRAGESSKTEFKEDSVHNDRLAREIAAFANFKGGVILLGVSDAGEIVGLTRDDNEERIMNICSSGIEPRLIPEYETLIINDKRLALLTIDIGREKPYAVLQQGRRAYYIRVGSTSRESTQRELMRMFQDSGALHFEVLPTNADFAELDRTSLFEYFRTFRNIDFADLQDDELRQALVNSSIMSENGQLTVAGCLLFAKHPAQCYAGTGAAFAAIDGNEPGDPLQEVVQCDGPVFDNVERLFKLFHSYNRSQVNGLAQNGERREDYEYPFRVFREMLINAFIHRDYSIEGSQIRVFRYRDFLEVRSPGLIPNFLTVEKMKMGVNYYRNPVLMSYFYDKRLIERLGRGVRMMFAEMRKHNDSEPKIVEEGGELVVRIWKKYL